MTAPINDPDKLNAAQRNLLRRAAAAQKKVVAQQEKASEVVAQRDDLILAAMEQGVGESLMSRTLELSRSYINKMRRKRNGSGS